MRGYRPQRGFHIGEMRSRIDVHNEHAAQDNSGQPVVTLVPWLKSEPAKFDPTSGGEGSRGRQVEAGIAAVFTVRYRQQYTPQMAVTCGGQRYYIVYVQPVDGMNVYQELHCKAVVI